MDTFIAANWISGSKANASLPLRRRARCSCSLALRRVCQTSVIKQGAEIEPRVRMRVGGISRTLYVWKDLPSSRGDTQRDSESIAINAVQCRRRHAALPRLSGGRPYRCLVAWCRRAQHLQESAVSQQGAITTVQGFAKPASFVRARLNWLFEAQHVEGWNEILYLTKTSTKSAKLAKTGHSRECVQRSGSE